MKLETKRLILRKLTLNDVEDIHGYMSKPEVTHYLTLERHQSPTDTLLFVKQMIDLYDAKGIKLWGIECKQNQKLIGTISLTPWQKRPIAGIGYLISPQYWNKGIATEAVKEIIKFAFEELGLQRIQAQCISQNIASAAVLEKVGMYYEGIQKNKIKLNGKSYDIKSYFIIKN